MRKATVPLSVETLTALRREVDDRRVDVEFLSPPISANADGSKIHRVLTASGRVRLDETGTNLNLLNSSGQRAIPLERVRSIDGGHVFSHAAWGGLVAFAVGAVLGGVIGAASEGPLQNGGTCLASSPDWICYERGDLATLCGAFFALALTPVGTVVGGHIDPGSRWVFSGQSEQPALQHHRSDSPWGNP
jgi:hypothetical protein